METKSSLLHFVIYLCSRKSIVICSALLILHISHINLFSEEHLPIPNTLTFENHLGEEAILKLLGPSGKVFSIQNGQTKSENVLPGAYTVFARCGNSKTQYKYFKIDSFEIGNPCGVRAQIRRKDGHGRTITLAMEHLKIPISPEEFDKVNASDSSIGTGYNIAQGSKSEGPEDDPVDKFIAAFDGGNIIERFRIVEILGECADKKTIGTLNKALKDEDDNVRWRAAMALRETKFPEAVEPLISALEDKSYRVVEEALYGLMDFKDSRATLPIIRILRGKGIALKREAAWALGEIGSPQAVEPLIESLQEENDEVREYATRALWKIRDARAEPFIIIRLKDKNPRVRMWAAEYLGDRENKQVIELLMENLTDWHSNSAVAKSLIKLGWKPGSEADRIHLMIAKRQKKELENNWKIAETVLLQDIETKSYFSIENALYTFVGLGKTEYISLLINKLNKNEDKVMAEAFLNCGQEELVKAAKGWAAKRGYNILEGSGSHPVSWGSMK